MNRLLGELRWQLNYDIHLIRQMQEELSELPKGFLVSKRIKGKDYVYIRRRVPDKQGSMREREIYVNSGKLAEARAVLRRRFLEKSIQELEGEIKRLQRFEEYYKPYDPDRVLESVMKGAAVLLNNISKASSHSDLEVARSDAERGLELFQEGKKHYTPCGLMVRSKSEALIAGILELYNLDFRYEQRLNLGGNGYYPDFTIRIPDSREWIYWEHFGLMQEPDYRKSMENKMLTYENHGIIPWHNLIMTFDSEDGSINMQRIHQILCNMIGVAPLTR